MKDKILTLFLCLFLATNAYADCTAGANCASYSVLLGGSPNDLNSGTTEYNYINSPGANTWTASETLRDFRMPFDGYVENLKVRVTTAPGEGNSFVFTVREDAGATTLTCTISGAVDTSCTDTTHSASVSTGGLITIEVNPDDSPTVSNAYWSYVIRGSAGTHVVSGMSKDGLYAGGGTYLPWVTSDQYDDTDEDDVGQIIPTPGDMDDLYVQSLAAPGEGKSRTYYLREGKANSDTLYCAIADAAQSCSSADEEDMDAGDLISLRQEPAGTPAGMASDWATTWKPTTAGEYIWLGNSFTDTGATKYWTPAGGDCRESATEADIAIPVYGVELRDLFVRVEVAPGGEETTVITVRDDGEDTALSCTITGAETSCNDTGETISVAEDSLVSVSVVQSGGNGSELSFGITNYIADESGAAGRTRRFF